jgi:hypothetical protein
MRYTCTCRAVSVVAQSREGGGSGARSGAFALGAALSICQCAPKDGYCRQAGGREALPSLFAQSIVCLARGVLAANRNSVRLGGEPSANVHLASVDFLILTEAKFAYISSAQGTRGLFILLCYFHYCYDQIKR